MKITTQDIIKLLPFDDTFKNNLLARWETFTPDQKLAIGEILWDEYAHLYRVAYEENMYEAMSNVAKGTEKMDKDFGKRVREKTKQSLMAKYDQNVPQTNLAEAREALKDIIDDSSKQSN